MFLLISCHFTHYKYVCACYAYLTFCIRDYLHSTYIVLRLLVINAENAFINSVLINVAFEVN